jgi:hypothetical protein
MSSRDLTESQILSKHDIWRGYQSPTLINDIHIPTSDKENGSKFSIPDNLAAFRNTALL